MAKSIWDEIKDLFKTDSQKAEERQKEIDNALSQEKGIVDQLAALEKEYKDSLPPEEEIDLEKLFPSDSGLRELEYSVDSDEDIAARAEKESAYNKQVEVNGLEDRYQKQLSALDGTGEKATQSLQDGYKQLEELYNELRKRSENDTLKRGLARSSIATNQLSNLDAARLANTGELQASYNAAMNDIAMRINELEANRETALSELDLKYAVELDERISKLKAERDKTVEKYEEYNRNIREKNDEYAKQRDEDIAEYLKNREEEKIKAQEAQAQHEKKYGYSGEKRENYAKRYEIAYNFYSSLSPDIAADALAASPNMKYYLGEYYNTLMSALKKSQKNQTYVF
ncbi:MAG: hypothetical protein K2G31_01695 [Clostridia bacterium]|nr:hypothetical protein [Clostridia bacterium]